MGEHNATAFQLMCIIVFLAGATRDFEHVLAARKDSKTAKEGVSNAIRAKQALARALEAKTKFSDDKAALDWAGEV